MRAIISAQSSSPEKPLEQDRPEASSRLSDSGTAPLSTSELRNPSPRPLTGLGNALPSTAPPCEVENPAWQPSKSSSIQVKDTKDHWLSSLPTGDIVDRGIVSEPAAKQLMGIYVNDLYPHYPILKIPANMDIQHFRRSKPTLFLAVIAAAAANTDPSLYGTLSSEILRAYAIKIVMSNEKTLELVQALSISAVWCFPADHFTRLQFYQHIHMAATMALDINLGSRPLQSSQLLDLDRQNTFGAESIRTFMACYLNCSLVSVSMRRPNMLRYTDWIEDCVCELEAAADGCAHDLALIAWVRLYRIAEEIAVSFNYDDPSRALAIEDAKLRLLLKGFMKQLQNWESETGPNLLHGALQIMYSSVKVFLHEILLYNDHPPGDFRPPHPTETLRILRSDTQPVPFPEGLAAIISSSQALLLTFIGLDTRQARSLPSVLLVRVRYAVYVLCKLLVSVQDPSSLISRVVDPESLNLEYFLRQTRAKLQAAAEPPGWNVPSLFLGLIQKFYIWYMYQIGQSDSAQISVGEPAQSFDHPLLPSKNHGPDQSDQTQMDCIAVPDNYPVFGNSHDGHGNTIEGMDLFVDEQIVINWDWNLDLL
ncbi:MAG: hypothetical protein Q9165_004176 [Trypethelium subeluteriae]